MSGAQCTPQHRLIQGPRVEANESVLRTTVMGEGHPHANENGPRNSTGKGRSTASMPTAHRHNPTCPECGGPAARDFERDEGNVHHWYGVCKLGHIWDLRWFAVRGA